MSERAGVVAPVRLDDPDDDVALLVLGLEARGLEHRVRLADAGRRAEEDGELAARGPRLLLADAREELVGIGPLLGHRAMPHTPSAMSRRARGSARAR